MSSVDQSAPPLLLSLTDSGAHLRMGGQEQIGYLLMQIKPSPAADIKSHSPLNLAVVIDRSTSMKGERLQKIKAAANLLLEKLTPLDHLSVISYSDRANVVISAAPVRDKPRLMAQLSGIQAGGGTETFQGLAAAVNELNKAPRNEFVSHLILLTDGHTYGDDEKCITLAQKAAEAGIGMSAFGLGSEWNDFFLDELVSPSGGQSGYIEEPEQIIHLLRRRISGLGAVYAQNVRLKLSLPDEVTIEDAFKVTPFAQPVESRNSAVQLGSIEGRVPLTLLLELKFKTVTQKELFFPFVVRAHVPTANPNHVALTNRYRLDVGRAQKKLPRKLMEAVRMLNLNRMNDRAFAEVEAGDVQAATKRMAYLTKRLNEAGLESLALTAKAQTIQLGQNGTLAKSSRMAIKYGTRVELTQKLASLFDLGPEGDDAGGDGSAGDRGGGGHVD